MKHVLAVMIIGALSACGGGASKQRDALDGGAEGLVQPLAALPAGFCGNRRSFRCPNDAGPCLTWDTPTGQTVLLDGAQFSERQAGNIVGNEYLFTTGNGDGGSDLWSAAAGRAPTYLSSSPTRVGGISAAAKSPDGGAWFVEFIAIDDFHFDVTSVTEERGVVTPWVTSLSAPTSNGVAYGEWYFVAFERGLYALSSRGAPLLIATNQYLNDDLIISIAVDEETQTIFYVRSTENSFRLLSRPLYGTVDTVLAELPTMRFSLYQNGGMLVVHDGFIYVNSLVGVYRVPMTGGQLELVYPGEELEYIGGAIKPASMVIHGDKLYFGELCHYEDQIAGYGTVELDLTQLTARWLDLDPAYPLVPHVTDYGAYGSEGVVHATPDGAFIFRE